ncbi:phosphate signaling complex protein PhoU [Candidatus Marithrix sp. Canyon 246]|uniref:phosphate signaling complex protein PhoU n=1 Tax=Candidatus Marithrix sp. Canyon 246 TaxID=1827136 RepID=UPI00084A1380|nr:phosphate signaling complex protein PhoU [Candidatus Marithrix sp. Canyon 246]
MAKLARKHISHSFDVELTELKNKVLSMGGLVEEQLTNAMTALTKHDTELAQQVYNNDYKINALEVSLDEESTRILAIRHPAASDLRLVMAIIKTIPDLERIGDQAERIAHMTLQMQGETPAKYFIAMNHLGEHVQLMLHNTLDAFARFDVDMAIQVMEDDLKIDQEYDNISRQLITYMMEDPRIIPIVLNILWSARALERVAAHSRHICEYIIYYVEGKDIRHISLDQLKQETS